MAAAEAAAEAEMARMEAEEEAERLKEEAEAEQRAAEAKALKEKQKPADLELPGDAAAPGARSPEALSPGKSPHKKSAISATKAKQAAFSRTQALHAKVEEEEQAQAANVLASSFNSLFVSEWLTQHPLALSYPPHIWIHADCPPLPPGASETLQRVSYLNQAGVVQLQDAKLDYALMSFKEMEKAIKAALPAGKPRAALLAVAYSNIAGFYFRRGLPAPALQYAQRAATLEERAHGAVDFATLLRLGAVHSKSSKGHVRGLAHCEAAVEALRQVGSATTPSGAAPTPIMTLPAWRDAAARGAEGPAQPRRAMHAAYQAHLAVAYHNLAVELAYVQRLQDASAMIHVADELASQSIPAKHRWARAICASVQRLRDLHVTNSFVQHSLRPRLAVHQAREEQQRAAAIAASRAAMMPSAENFSFADTVTDSAGLGLLSASDPAAGQARRVMAPSSSLPAIVRR